LRGKVLPPRLTSYAYTATDLQPSGDIDVNTGRGGLYFTYFSHGFYINGAAYGGHNTYNTSRQGILGAANGSTSGGEFSTFGQAGYDFHFGNFAVGPLFALQYTLAHVDGFNEQGSLVPLNIHSDSEDFSEQTLAYGLLTHGRSAASYSFPR